MCWIGREVDRHIAKEDVKVFKVLYTKPKGWHDMDRKSTRDFLAPYYHFYYKLNMPYHSDVDVNTPLGVVPYSCFDLDGGETTDRRNIHKALHCYSSDMCSWVKTDVDTVTVTKKYFDRQLVHYSIYDNRSCEAQPRVAAIVEGIIPAGTEYWQNEKGEIATSKLILREVKKIF
jgi:hypothetical protein